MNPAEIVKSKLESISVFQIEPFLREGISETGHATHRHANGEILSFNV